MIKIKIDPRYYTVVSACNIRQWCLALLALPEVQEVTGDDYADLGINTKNNVGKSVRIDTSDPQSLIKTYDVDLTPVKKYVDLLQVPYIKPSIVFANGSDRGIGFIRSWDYYASMISTEITRELVEPQLTNTKVLDFYHSLPPYMFYYTDKKKDLDSIFIGAMRPQWYPLRDIFHNEIIKHPEIKYYNSRANGTSQKHKVSSNPDTALIEFEKQMFEYANQLRRSKTMLLGSSIFNIAIKKYIEGMACGCLILAPMPRDGRQMGFIDGVNMVVVDENNFMDKLRYYLKHEDERKTITSNAYQLYRKRFTCEKSARALLKQII